MHVSIVDTHIVTKQLFHSLMNVVDLGGYEVYEILNVGARCDAEFWSFTLLWRRDVCCVTAGFD